MAFTFSKLATVAVGAGGSATISFTNIPQNYKDLCIKISARNTNSANNRQIRLTLNNVSSGQYSYRNLFGDGGGVTASTESSVTSMFAVLQPAGTSTSNTFGNTEFYFPNYTSSNNKSISFDGVTENNASEAYTNLNGGIWANTSSIISIQLVTNSGNFAQYSTATLYGIRAEV
jgi:hypothetical protein